MGYKAVILSLIGSSAKWNNNTVINDQRSILRILDVYWLIMKVSVSVMKALAVIGTDALGKEVGGW